MSNEIRQTATINRVIAGALFDLMGYLTCRDEVSTFSSRHEAGPAVQVLSEWAARRGLPLDEAMVEEWREQAGILIGASPKGGSSGGDVSPAIDLMRRIRLHLDRAASINGDMLAGRLLAELDGSPCATLEELQKRMEDAMRRAGTYAEPDDVDDGNGNGNGSEESDDDQEAVRHD